MLVGFDSILFDACIALLDGRDRWKDEGPKMKDPVGLNLSLLHCESIRN